MSNTTHTQIKSRGIAYSLPGRYDVHHVDVVQGAIRFAKVEAMTAQDAKDCAALIVRAVNNHARLVDMVRRLSDSAMGFFGDKNQSLREESRALLAEVEA